MATWCNSLDTMSELPGPVDLQALVQALPEPVIILDRRGVLVWANPASEHLFGRRLEELAGSGVLGMVHPDDLAVATAAMHSVQEKEVGTLLEVRVRAADGWRLVELLGRDCVDLPGIGGQVLCLRDITGRRRWEVLGDDTARFRALVQHMPSVVMLADAQGLVRSVSAAVTRILGWDQELIEGRPLADLVVPAHRQRLDQVLADLVRAGAARRNESGVPTTPAPVSVEVDLRPARDPAPVPFELAIVNLLDDPVVGGLVISAHDLSALHDSEAELHEAQRHLVDHERLAAVGQFAAAIGHELRRPLWALTVVHHLLREALAPGPGSEIGEQLDIAERETARAVAVADDLLGYVRPHPPALEALAVSPVVREALSDASVPPGVVVSLHIDEERVVADHGQLVQMLANLIVNAVQAMGGAGRLDIATELRDGEVAVVVDDSGPGIDPTVAETIFDAFSTTKPDGMGLGLAIVQALVEGHGGRVTLENRPDGGARATLWLRAASATGASVPLAVPLSEH